MTHSDLIPIAAEWLRKKGSSVVITDMSHGGPETADAIGWRGAYSTLIECKASVSDFRADAEKSFRRSPESGMGFHRYYLAPAGMLKQEWLPDRWGLIEVGAKVRTVKQAEASPDYDPRQEISVLLSAIRRIGQTAPQGVSVRFYTNQSLCRATLGVFEFEA